MSDAFPFAREVPMSKIEMEESTDVLPSEILRQLQVEELWARRKVLAELMNAERFKLYINRRSDMGAGVTSMDSGPLVSQSTHSRPAYF